MKRHRYTIKEIETAVKSYYTELADRVDIPPVPAVTSHMENTGRENGSEENPVSLRFFFPRAAAAVLLIALGGFFFIGPPISNPLANTLTSIAEERQLEQKITSGLQHAGYFIFETLVQGEKK